MLLSLNSDHWFSVQNVGKDLCIEKGEATEEDFCDY